MPSRKRTAAVGIGVAAMLAAGISVYVGSTTIPGGCASSTANTPDGPDPWGGCWPGPTTTGVPAGTSLTVPGLDGDGNYPVTTNNAVIDGIDLTGVTGEGGILVEATGVTIKNSKVRFIITDFSAPIADNGAHPTVVQDTEIDCRRTDGGSRIATAAYYGFYELNRVKVHDCENGLDLASGKVNIHDSYWYHLYMCPTADCLPDPPAPHTGVVQGAPGDDAVIQHNWMEAINVADCSAYVAGSPNTGYGDGRCNASGVIGYNNTGSGTDNVLIKRNALKGGGSTIRCPQLPSTNVHITDNRMWSEYNDPAQHGTGLSDDCAPFDDGDNRDGATNALLTLT